MKAARFALLFAALAMSGRAFAEERILDFASEIVVAADASMTVRETIRVRAEGSEIKRGIYRDFPTRYRDALGHRVVVAFELVGTLRDGKPESSHTEARDNGVRVYLGREDGLLEPGEYTYTIAYRTTRQLGFFADHDELYWNVTGNGWAFPIDRATARVTLPRGVPKDAIRVEGYTGPEGSKARHLEARVTWDGVAEFATTRGLGAAEGLTIVVAFPKGFVAAPTREQQVRWLFADNRNALAGVAGLLVVLAYYTVVWARVGRDPAPGVIVTRYEPPDGFTPAAVRHLVRMAYDDKTMAATVVSLAVQKRLTIADEGGDWVLTRLSSKDGKLAPEENLVLEHLFGGTNRLELGRARAPRVRAAVEALKAKLAATLETHYFLRNARYVGPGAALSAVTVAAVVLASEEVGRIVGATFMMVWLSLWSLGVYALLLANVGAWRAALAERGARRVFGVVAAMFPSLFALPFVAGEIVGIGFLAFMTSVGAVVALALVIVANLVFYRLLRRPTRAGRGVLDQVEGFKTFLTAVEGDRLQRLPLERTPELFEKFLPYAMALDVEEEWAGQFADVLAAAGRDGGAYSPAWYSGAAFSAASPAAFTGALGSSMSSAISSSSTPPGSSSGSSGGGSSGGGGGGGGGGGW